MVLDDLGNGLIDRVGCWWSLRPSPSHPTFKKKCYNCLKHANCGKNMLICKKYVIQIKYAKTSKNMLKLAKICSNCGKNMLKYVNMQKICYSGKYAKTSKNILKLAKIR